MPIHLHIVKGCFPSTTKPGSVVTAEAQWPVKPKIFTNLPFTGSLMTPALKGNMKVLNGTNVI